MEQKEECLFSSFFSPMGAQELSLDNSLESCRNCCDPQCLLCKVDKNDKFNSLFCLLGLYVAWD